MVDRFRECTKNILGACKAYMDGDFKVSDEFKVLMNTMYGELDKAFNLRIILKIILKKKKLIKIRQEIDETETNVGSKRKTTISKTKVKKKKTKKGKRALKLES